MALLVGRIGFLSSFMFRSFNLLCVCVFAPFDFCGCAAVIGVKVKHLSQSPRVRFGLELEAET